LLNDARETRHRKALESELAALLEGLWTISSVGDVRRVGLIAGVELVKNWKTREPFKLAERAGARVCDAMKKRGVLTRPIGDVIVIMPPYRMTIPQLRRVVTVLAESIEETLGK
jgi:lysine--8-amino-7-oxononanoate aminotransferase